MSSKWDKILEIEKELNKRFETTSSLIRLGDKVGLRLPSIASEMPNLDYGVIGTGGLPKGRIIEIMGPESAGKTALALHFIGMAQKTGEICAFIDAEQSLDANWGKILGVNLDDLIVSQPNSGEEGLTIAESLIDSGAVGLVVVDSVSALVPRAEVEGEIGDSHMGLQARLLSQAMRMLVPKCRASNCSIIFINQLREKIGVFYGSNETTSGGRALKFYASVRLDVRRKEVIKEGDEILGHIVKIKAVKNKVNRPFQECLVNLKYDSGFDINNSIVDFAIDRGIIESSGAWYKLDGKNYRRDALVEVIDVIKEKVNESIRPS